jgi:uncharacterized membrane-anchored protein
VFSPRAATYRHDVAGPRAEARLKIFEMHDDYFAAHRRAAAFQWMKAGMYARQAGNHPLARRALAKAARLSPTPRTLGRVYRALTGPAG